MLPLRVQLRACPECPAVGFLLVTMTEGAVTVLIDSLIDGPVLSRPGRGRRGGEPFLPCPKLLTFKKTKDD